MSNHPVQAGFATTMFGRRAVSMYAMLRLAILVVLIVGVALVAGRRAVYLVRLVRTGTPDAERFRGVPRRLLYELQKVIGQRKLLQWSGPGIAHALTFWGFLVVQVALIESIGTFITPHFTLPWIGTHSWLGAVFDFFVAAVALSLAAFAIIRLRNRPRALERRSRFFGSHTTQAYVILLMIFAVVATLLATNAFRHALGRLPYARGAFLARPLGNWLATLTQGHVLERWELAFLTAHLAVVGSFLILVLYSKHLHIATSPLNVAFGRHPVALGRLRPLHIDVDEMTEDTVIGAGAVEDLSWKHHLDMLTCTECGRCQSACPAWNTGKELNPKLLVMDMRDHLFARGPILIDGLDPADPETPDEVRTLGTATLVPEVISEEVLWACVTCGACVQECPVDIEHVDMIVDMRRNQVMMESRFPREARGMLDNLESVGNPWGMSADKRLDWAEQFDVRVLAPGQQIPADAEYLFWVGCAGAFDDRAKKTTRAVAELLRRAGVGFAVLGPHESCTGDPARRIGNEFLFQEIAKTNVETLNGAGVRKIVAQCPHCFNTIRNEYPDYGGTYEVLHHTEVLSRLLADGRLSPHVPLDMDVTYHDPCYLARHNDVLGGPRDVIGATGARSHEMHRCGRKTFCCGAGGARFWMEETTGKRINHERIDEALGTDPDVVATACPFCLVMLDDAVKDRQMTGAGEGVEVVDVASLLARSIGDH